MRENKGRYQARYRRKKGFSLAAVITFIGERKFLFSGIAAAVVVVVVLFATGVLNMTPTKANLAQTGAPTVSGAQPTVTQTPSPSPSASTAVIGKTIGVSVLSPSLEDYTLMAYFDKEAGADQKAKELGGFILSNAKGDGKLQLTQVQDMIKKGANVIVVMGTGSDDFQKISALCAQSNVQIVACNVDATLGFAVDVMSQANHALKFAQFAQQNGATLIYTVGADATEVSTVNALVPVNANIASASASSTISGRLDKGETIQNLMFFDNSANSVLKTYIKKGVLPTTIATPAYVGFIKTWYALLHDGVPTTAATSTSSSPSASGSASASPSPSTSASASPSPSGSASAGASPSASGSATSGAVVKASPDQFHAIAYTKVQNLGEIVYRFALNLSSGRVLPQSNYLFDATGEEYITNDNIDSYYAKIGKLTDQDILTSIGDTSTVDALFS